MTTAPRLLALDVFRGVTIAGMILVNTPGNGHYVYSALEHAEWHGFTPTDLIFPFFLFIVGVSIHFSQGAHAQLSGAAHLRKVLLRTALLLLIGLALNAFPKFDLATLRIPGVLQRIALVSGATAILARYCSTRTLVVVSVVVLLGYWGVLALVPAPGLERAELSPDGNLGAYVDRWLFGARMWHATRDPEGALSTLPALVTGLSGALTGRFLTAATKRSTARHLTAQQAAAQVSGSLFSTGWGLVLLGLLWGTLFPINKNLWSSSYMLLSSGAALQALGMSYWLLEACQLRRWATPFAALGMNALLIYIGSGLLGDTLALPTAKLGTGGVAGWVHAQLLAPWAGPYNGSLLYALFHVALWCGVAVVLRRAKIFVKL